MFICCNDVKLSTIKTSVVIICASDIHVNFKLFVCGV